MSLRTAGVIMLILFSTATAAQQKLRFRNANLAGFMIGNTEPSWQLQTINGIAYKKTSIGFGAGLDAYYFKSIPLFADIRYELRFHRNSPFLYLNIGTNVPANQRWSDEWSKTEYNKGGYSDLGGGYKWSFSDGTRLQLSFGYTVKKIQEIKTFNWTAEGRSSDQYDYTFRRLSLKLGLGF